MNTHAIRTGVIIGAALLLVGLAVFFLGSNDATAPTTEDGVATTDTAVVATTTDSTEAASTEETSLPPAGVGPTPTPKPVTTTPPVTTPPKPAPAATYGALVVYTDTGFKPSRVTITQGQTVRFLNQSDSKMWVASNIHPIHAQYQEHSEDDCNRSTFDQCEYVDAGEYWDFKFNLIGSWDFHSEDRPTEDGTVTVQARN